MFSILSYIEILNIRADHIAHFIVGMSILVLPKIFKIKISNIKIIVFIIFVAITKEIYDSKVLSFTYYSSLIDIIFTITTPILYLILDLLLNRNRESCQ